MRVYRISKERNTIDEEKRLNNIDMSIVYQQYVHCRNRDRQKGRRRKDIIFCLYIYTNGTGVIPTGG